MRLYDTARQQVVPFEPPDRVVTMYTCGITPYDSTHLGHAATYLTYDVLQRRLRDLGHETRCVRNITDVDDSILPKARELGVHYLDLAAAELARFDADMERLDMIPAWSEPRATSAIPDIRGFIGMVLEAGLRLPGRGRRVLRGRPKFPQFGADQPPTAATRCSTSPGSAAATPTTRTSATRSTSCCGSRRLPDEPSWDSLWGPAGRAGTSSARPCACASSAPRSTCTVAAPT